MVDFLISLNNLFVNLVVYDEKTVVEDGNVMTSRGPGTALCFGLSIVAKLAGKEKAQQIKQAMLPANVCD